jgi:hypothetical protein
MTSACAYVKNQHCPEINMLSSLLSSFTRKRTKFGLCTDDGTRSFHSPQRQTAPSSSFACLHCEIFGTRIFFHVAMWCWLTSMSHACCLHTKNSIQTLENRLLTVSLRLSAYIETTTDVINRKTRSSIFVRTTGELNLQNS